MEKESTTAERLQRLRMKLLDLTTNNRMLSYRHPKVSCIRVVDELPQVLFESLVGGESLTFDAVEEPSKRELDAWHARRDQVPRAGEAPDLKKPDAGIWARHLGINTDYDLPIEPDAFDRPARHSDKKIQTLHYPDEMDVRLRRIRSAARTAIEESGANMLYVAFGFLEWRDQSTARGHQAPLVMLPVELDREPTKAGKYRTRLRWAGEELQPNLSLQKKLDEFGIKLPDLGDGQELEDYLSAVASAVRHKADWFVRRYVTLGLFEFGKILLYLDLDPERWPEHAKIVEHPLVRTVLQGEDIEPREEGGPIASSPDPSDFAKIQDLELTVVDKADSSQCEALYAALHGRNLVIEGPPGTGKSQTITNLIAAALAQGKTVLFVAEKLAALEVVRRRLRELGLGEFCLELHSHKTRKGEMLEDIADRLKASTHSRHARDLEAALGRLSDRRKKLAEYIAIAAGPVGSLRDFTISDALMQAGRARRRLGSVAEKIAAAGPTVKGAGNLRWADLADAKARLKQFVSAFQELAVVGSAFEHPWAGVSAARVLPHDSARVASLATRWADALDQLDVALQQNQLQSVPAAEFIAATPGFAVLDQLRPAAVDLEETLTVIEARLGVVIPRTVAGLGLASDVLRVAAAAPAEQLELRNSRLLQPGAAAALLQYKESIGRLEAARQRVREIFRTAALTTHPEDIEEYIFAFGQRGLLVRFGSRWKSASVAWTQLARPAHLKARKEARIGHLHSLQSFIQGEGAFKADRSVDEFLGADGNRERRDLDGAIAIAQWVELAHAALPEAIASTLSRASSETLSTFRALSINRDAVAVLDNRLNAPGATTLWNALVVSVLPGKLAAQASKASSTEAWKELQENVSACAGFAQAEMDSGKAFATATGLEPRIWLRGDNPTLAGAASRARLAAANVETLSHWLDFDRVRRASDGSPEAEIIEAVTNGTFPAQRLDVCFDFLVFDQLARAAFTDFPSLLSTTGKTLDALRDDYRSMDAQVMELRRASLAANLMPRRGPAGQQTGRVADLTEMALLNHLLSKQRPRFAVRQLVARAGKSLQALKPCFMMGPLSVAQYIAPGTLKFDLVIMDEASQMRPEDAIGALARGGQAIIVGDTKQLPPTSFFDRVAQQTGDDGVDDNVILAEDSKSILELASSLFESRMLRWHYRSRHEALIAFSNRQFYRDDLVVFPSPADQSGHFGVGWNFVSDGVATTGVNPAEARVVAAAAARFLLEHKNRSLGVAAMNIKQSERIRDELQRLADGDPALAQAMSDAENDPREPFFIKNLENVQGDERDVVMISMTYGPSTPGGHVPQNFGPINQDTGWRRLNVLFTRAKERMEIFSSMRAGNIFPKEGGDRGPGALKKFLTFAESGSLDRSTKETGRPTGSDFEDAVIEGLRELNFECVPQVGVANFFLDIGVRARDGQEFVAAIECDGAAYHSQKSARDRDRLRQEILENLGWKIIRIWSTDWFRDPAGELDRVAQALRGLIAEREEKRSAIRGILGEKEIVVREAPEAVSANPTTQFGLFGTETVPLQPRKQTSSMSLEQARAKLIDLRERSIKTQFPDADPTIGLLRKTMLDELLRKRPTDMDEFRSMIRLDLREVTDSQQLKEFGEIVFDVLANIVV